MAKKGLGTGLDALFGGDFSETTENDFEYLPLSRIEPNTDQPRSFFDESGLDELAESIREHGVIQPLTVRRLGDGYYQIIAGERRWRAARIAELDTVPARIIEADDRKAMELALVENLQREGLNPIEEAKGYKTLMDEYKLTQDETAKRVGKSRPVIANSIRLLTLPDEIIEMLENGSLSAGSARALLAIEGAENQIDAARYIAESGMSVREAEKLAKMNANPKKKREKTPKSIYVKQAERTLEEHLGRKVKISGSGIKGKIEIEYYDADDFEKIYEILNNTDK